MRRERLTVYYFYNCLDAKVRTYRKHTYKQYFVENIWMIYRRVLGPCRRRRRKRCFFMATATANIPTHTDAH